MQRALTLMVTLVATGCVLFTGPEDKLQEARARWDEAGLASYSYEYSLSCFCGAPANLPLVVAVENGEVTGAWNLNDFVPLDPGLLASLHTVPELFDIAERALREAYKHHLSYDEFYGYPRTMDIDWIKDAIDDEATHRSACLHQTSSEAATSAPCWAPPL